MCWFAVFIEEPKSKMRAQPIETFLLTAEHSALPNRRESEINKGRAIRLAYLRSDPQGETVRFDTICPIYLSAYLLHKTLIATGIVQVMGPPTQYRAPD
jgi:hypothetical protein